MRRLSATQAAVLASLTDGSASCLSGVLPATIACLSAAGLIESFVPEPTSYAQAARGRVRHWRLTPDGERRAAWVAAGNRGVTPADASPAPAAGLTAEAVLREFVDDVNSTRGLTRNPRTGFVVPHAAADWSDLAATYLRACAVLGLRPDDGANP